MEYNELKDIYIKFLNLIDNYVKHLNLTYDNLFRKNLPINKAFLDDMLKIIFENFSNYKEVIDFNNVILNSNEYKNIPYNNIISKFTECFIPERYIDILNKTIKSTVLDVNNDEQCSKKIKKLQRSYDFPSIITSDGICYLARNRHEDLTAWLNLNNIDIHGSIRVKILKQFLQLEIGSLYGYEYLIDENKDKEIYLKDAQVETLRNLYYKISKLWGQLKPIQDSLKISDNLCLESKESYDKNPDFGKHNLILLEFYFGKNNIDIKDYLENLRFTNNHFDNLFTNY